ncbi:MAG TPA: ribosome maturation factor RimM [Actinomycetes bacterium]|nr:ribosome maturation factor RimM [Actinomycetes bacterium]
MARGDKDQATVVVGRIGRPHGVRGDVTVEVRTDEPDRRFDDGVVLHSDRSGVPTLTVESHRWHSGRLLVHLRGIDDRTAAEALRGALLSVSVDPDELPEDPEEYYDHQLVGLTAVDPSGAAIGEVIHVVHGGQDHLVVRLPSGREAAVPFVEALVPDVDLAAGRVVIDAPEGLLDLAGEPIE